MCCVFDFSLNAKRRHALFLKDCTMFLRHSFRLTAVSIAAMAAAGPLWAACTADSVVAVTMITSATATGQTVCVPTLSAYTGSSSNGTVVANGAGAVINIGNSTTSHNTRGGGTGGAFYALGGTAANPSQINSTANAKLTATTGTTSNTHGFRASGYGQLNLQGDIDGTVSSNQGRALLIEGSGTITVGGNATLDVASTAQQNSRAIALEASTTAAQVYFKKNVTASLFFDNASGVSARGGKLTIDGKYTVLGYPAKPTFSGIYAIATTAPITIQLADFEFTNPGGTGINVDASTSAISIASSKAGVITSELPNFIAVRSGSALGSVALGPNSFLNVSGAGAVGVEVVGAALFSAQDGLKIKAAQTGFAFTGATAPITLSNATVQAPTVWSSTGATNIAFTANGGAYTGLSTQTAGQLNIALASNARWNMPDASSLQTLTLSSGGTLDASIKGGPVALTGNVANTGGVVSLQQGAQLLSTLSTLSALAVTKATPLPSDILQVSGNYAAGGGSLLLDTTLNAGGAASESDVLQAASVTLVGAPTSLQIAPSATSAGAATTGKGILVVAVTGGSAASAPGAFVLSGSVVNNGYAYSLVQDTGDGNWYLQSKLAPVAQPDAAIALTGPAAAFPVNAPQTLTVSVKNDGSFGDIVDGTLTVTLPASVRLSGAAPAGCTVNTPAATDPQVLTCAMASLGPVAPGASTSPLSLNVSVAAGGSYTINAAIAGVTGETNTANNSQSLALTVSATDTSRPISPVPLDSPWALAGLGALIAAAAARMRRRQR